MASSGWGHFYLAGAKDDSRWKPCPVVQKASFQPHFGGSVSDFIQSDPILTRHMSNHVRVCGRCRKSCGKTLNACNNCAYDISGEPITRTDNALMGFVYGLKEFPTSIRFENKSFLVYDDLMQTTLIHLNSIPTDVYVPDFRYLFSDPTRGLDLINSLFLFATEAAVGMLANGEFCGKFFSSGGLKEMNQLGLEGFVKRYVFCGFNYPPSQCQLHLQFIIPPYVPYHAVLLAEGKHSDFERFFTYDFVRDCLEGLVKMGESIQFQQIEPLSGRELIALIHSKLPMNYYRAYYESLSRHRNNNSLLSNWDKSDFRYIIMDKTEVLPIWPSDCTEDVVQNLKPADIQAMDKTVITSYGKGIGMQYYSFAKSPGDVVDWAVN